MGYDIVVEPVKYEETETENKAGLGLVACDWKQNIGYICAGDIVLISDEDNNKPVIEVILPRKNFIEKQNVYRGAKPFASNIDQVLIVITHSPMFQPSLLDRYLITAEKVGIDCIIFFNKVDTFTESETINKINKFQQIYNNLESITWVKGSTYNKNGLDELTKLLNNKKTVITGQSGVGKSTLINTLIPDLNIQTMEISKASGLGKHSTTNSTLYHLDENSFLIDTPGVRSFDTYHFDIEDIMKGFVEIYPFVGTCKFSNCSHIQEKGCSIIEAVKNEDISESRYKSFMQIISEVKNER